MAMGLSLLQLFVDDVRVRAAITIICAVGVAVSVVKVLSGISPYFGQTALFIFLRLVLQPGLGEAMFVWLTRFKEGPQLSAQLMGVTDCFGQAGLLLGLVCYRSFMTNWSYRKIFLVGQMAYLISQLLDICLVMRWNRLIGIPDFLFYVGDTAFDLAVSKLFYVPLVVLAYKVCPENLEATLFATLMALNNIGVDTGKFLGVSLCELWGIVDGNFDYLVHGLVTKALCRLLPIPLIFLLIPRQLTPNDPVPVLAKKVSIELEEEEPTKDIPVAEKAQRRCFWHWLRELYAAFGNFIPFAVLTYGVNQSVAWAIGGFAIRFYMKDVLGLDGATMGRLTTAAGLPWNMKPFMGMLSDGIAFCGYHRRSYIVVAAADMHKLPWSQSLSTLSYATHIRNAKSYGLGPTGPTLLFQVVVMIVINLSVSTTDVIVDGKVRSTSFDWSMLGQGCKSKALTYNPYRQSLFWGVSAIFGLASSSLKGALVEWFSPQKVLLSMTACSVSLLLPALWGWMPEERLPEARCCNVKLDQFRKHPSVSAVAVLMTVVSTFLSSFQVMISNTHARAIITLLCAAAVAVQSYRALKQNLFRTKTKTKDVIEGLLQGLRFRSVSIAKIKLAVPVLVKETGARTVIMPRKALAKAIPARPKNAKT
ncbi:unnamed protein product [Symbiodinium sp. KB8]|nr:unnamed protein product [Symbiodinium sp. KB8]